MKPRLLPSLFHVPFLAFVLTVQELRIPSPSRLVNIIGRLYYKYTSLRQGRFRLTF